MSTESILLMVMQVQQSVESSLLSIQKGAVLPVNWLMKTDSNGLILGKIRQIPSSSSTSDQPLSLSHCLTIYENLTWTLYIHGKKVDVGMCAALESVPVLLQPTTVNHLLATLDSLNVCIGSPEEHFVELCDSHHGRILSPDGSVAAYKDTYCAVTSEGVFFDSTVRASKCSMVVSGGSKCDFCRKYRSVLRAMQSRQKKCPPSSEKTMTSSHVNYRYLSTPEKIQRMANLRSKVVQQKRKIALLEEKVKNLTESSGVEVDKEMHDDLGNIMEEMTEKVESKFSENSFEHVFWSQQLQAKKVNDYRQMRWHPAIIKWCLSLKMLSSSSYRALRSSGALGTLRDYTHWMKSDAGFSESVDRELLKEAKIDSVDDFQKHVCLVFDEVRIKEDLVYDKHSLQIIGFVNLGNVNNELLKLEHLESGKLEQCVATNMLVFMVRNLFSKLEFHTISLLIIVI